MKYHPTSLYKCITLCYYTHCTHSYNYTACMHEIVNNYTANRTHCYRMRTKPKSKNLIWADTMIMHFTYMYKDQNEILVMFGMEMDGSIFMKVSICFLVTVRRVYMKSVHGISYHTATCTWSQFTIRLCMCTCKYNSMPIQDFCSVLHF